MPRNTWTFAAVVCERQAGPHARARWWPEVDATSVPRRVPLASGTQHNVKVREGSCGTACAREHHCSTVACWVPLDQLDNEVLRFEGFTHLGGETFGELLIQSEVRTTKYREKDFANRGCQ